MRKPLLLALSLLGLWDSIYLWWVYTSPSRPMVCLGTGCDVVRASSFAHLWGLPLPVYGVAMYGAVALLSFAEPLFAAGAASGIRYAVAMVSASGFLASLYLTRIEATVLHAWCAWCVVSAFAVSFIFVLALAEVVQPRRREPGEMLGVLRRYFVVFLGALIIGTPAFVFLARHGTPPPPEPVSPQALAEHLVRPDSHMTGNPQAVVTVVEFGDFECPYCQGAELVAREIRRKFGTQVRFVFRQFPMTGIHPQAEKAAEASECAAEQGKFWKAVEKFYDLQTDLSEPTLVRYAGELGLDQRRFRECLSSGRMAARVERDVVDARTLGVSKTPTFFIGQRRIEGALEFSEFTQLVNKELASRGGATAQATAPGENSTQGEVHKAPQTNLPKPDSDPREAGASPLFTNPASTFSQFQTSALACSEEEAKKYQPTLIRTAEARKLFASAPRALFVDVRSRKDFETGRIPGAISVPVDQMGQRWDSMPKDRMIIFYESGRTPGDVCAFGRAAARVLLAHGFAPEYVRVYQDGIAAWEKAGLPVER